MAMAVELAMALAMAEKMEMETVVKDHSSKGRWERSPMNVESTADRRRGEQRNKWKLNADEPNSRLQAND